MNKAARLTRPYKRMYKLICSYLKSDWKLDDYPIEFLKFRQKENELTEANLTFYPWVARIINWYWMNGVGYTKEEALQNLKDKFNEYKAEGSSLPRPGTRVEIRFASIDRIEGFEQEGARFFRDIFELDYYGMFISDESSLYDFCLSDEILSEKILKIKEIYGIDMNDIEDYLIVDILERIRDGRDIT